MRPIPWPATKLGAWSSQLQRVDDHARPQPRAHHLIEPAGGFHRKPAFLEKRADPSAHRPKDEKTDMLGDRVEGQGCCNEPPAVPTPHSLTRPSGHGKGPPVGSGLRE
jgi:hypothetical protein